MGVLEDKKGFVFVLGDHEWDCDYDKPDNLGFYISSDSSVNGDSEIEVESGAASYENVNAITYQSIMAYELIKEFMLKNRHIKKIFRNYGNSAKKLIL
jgi:hypothetical protein